MVTFIVLNRLLIGVLFAVPFMFFGFFTELAILEWDTSLITDSWFRLLSALGVSITLLPYIWMSNDYFDAPFDRLNEKKRRLNYFCSTDIQEKPKLAILILLTPIILSFFFSVFNGLESIVVWAIVLMLGHLYNAPPIRFKERFFFDFFTHGLYASGLFFLLGGLVLSPFSQLLRQPLFLLLFLLSVIDGGWLQFASQIRDYEIDKKGNQKTTSVVCGEKWSAILLHGLVCSMLLICPLYLLLNTSLNDLIPNVVISIAFIISVITIILYIIRLYKVKHDFMKIRKLSGWIRRRYVYPFGLISVLLINWPFD
jgi:4-hydroxybenzoate polyprenyltransferase